MWKDLSLKEKAAFMLVAVNNGIYDLLDILQHYNKFAEGGLLNPYSAGSLVDAIYKNFKGEEYLGEPSHHYDFTISEEEANRLGYYPDERGHRDDRVKKPAHPTHPSRGKWNSFEEFELTDRGMENPNYTLFGLNDGGQDPQAIMTYRGGVVLPEITVTPKKKYIHNPYDNINIYAEGGYVREKNNNPISFDEEGNLTDLITGEKGTMMLPNLNVYGHKDVADFVYLKRLNNLINHSEINPFTGDVRVIGLERTYPEFELLGFKDLASPIFNSIKKGVTYSAAKLGNKLAQSKIIADIMDNTFDILNYQYSIPYMKNIVLRPQSKPLLGLPAPTKRKLLQTNVLESSGETIPLTRFTTSLMEDMIDKVNKWGARYKYSMIPKSAAKNPRFAEELILDRLTEHNTFVRGVRDDYRHRDNVNLLASELLGVENPNVFDRLQVMATSYAPKTGSGRAGFTPEYEGLGTIYASNSLGTAKAYSSRNHLGEGFGAIAVVRRPLDFDAPLDTWLTLADIPFKNKKASVIYSKYNLPFLNLTGKSLNTVAKEMKTDLPIPITETDIISKMNNHRYTPAQEWVNKIITKNQLYSNRFKYANTYINPLSINLLVNERLALELYKSLNNFLVFNDDFINNHGFIDIQDISRLIDNPEFIETFNKYAGRIYNKHHSNLLKLLILNEVRKRYKRAIGKSKLPTVDDYSKILELYNVSPNSPHFPLGSDGLITSENLRTSSRGNPDAYQHFIFIGPENTLGLEFVKFLNPDNPLPITGEITRTHVGQSSAGLSRKSKAYGGYLTIK